MRCQGGLAIFQLLTFIHIQEIIYLFGLVFRINYEKKNLFLFDNKHTIFLYLHLISFDQWNIFYGNYIDTECNNQKKRFSSYPA